MVFAGFLSGPQHHVHAVKLISWNINGVRTKLEKHCVQDFLMKYDIVCLNEVKTPLRVCLPGYVSYMSNNKTSPHRGGTVVMVKNYLAQSTLRVDTSTEDQVWLQFRSLPGVVVAACYIPPSDSPYFSHDSFASIQDKVIENGNEKKYVIIGDLNARFGEFVRELPMRAELPDYYDYSYPRIPDHVDRLNDNAYVLATLCIDHKFVVVNNLRVREKEFTSNVTYRQGDVWISELDICMTSSNMVNHIDEFSVHQTDFLPSDHAPVSLQLSVPDIDISDLFNRACQLGEHAILKHSNHNAFVKKPINWPRIDQEAFVDNISNTNVDTNVSDVNEFAKNVAEVLYECSQASQGNVVVADNVTRNTNRWDRILHDRDDARVWKAIDWKGKFQNRPTVHDSPTDDEFKTFFETVTDLDLLDDFEENDVPNINIPVLDESITTDEVTVQIKKMKADKACGPDGIAPGVFQLLPANWIVILTVLFNSVFLSASYPVSWTTAKFFTIFKKGNRQEARNYRGISVLNSITKVYDLILCERLRAWFIPYREQAGAQEGRGCTEHIVTLRLLTDFAKKKRKTPYLSHLSIFPRLTIL